MMKRYFLVLCMVLGVVSLFGQAGRLVSGGTTFNSNRSILRTYSTGISIGGTTVNDVLEWMYYSPPTLSSSLSPSTTFYEVGTSNSVSYLGATSNPSAATLANGAVKEGAITLLSFGASATYNYAFTFAPTAKESHTYVATQDYSGIETGTATAAGRTINADYPIFYGMSATLYTGGAVPYSTFTKLVQSEGNKTVSLTGTNEYIYYLVPVSWGDYTLSSILDGNGFELLGAFTAYDVTVISTGLTNNWTQDYKLYKLNNLTNASAVNYQFIR